MWRGSDIRRIPANKLAGYYHSSFQDCRFGFPPLIPANELAGYCRSSFQDSGFGLPPLFLSYPERISASSPRIHPGDGKAPQNCRVLKARLIARAVFKPPVWDGIFIGLKSCIFHSIPANELAGYYHSSLWDRGSRGRKC